MAAGRWKPRNVVGLLIRMPDDNEFSRSWGMVYDSVARLLQYISRRIGDFLFLRAITVLGENLATRHTLDPYDVSWYDAHRTPVYPAVYRTRNQRASQDRKEQIHALINVILQLKPTVVSDPKAEYGWTVSYGGVDYEQAIYEDWKRQALEGLAQPSLDPCQPKAELVVRMLDPK